MTRFFGGIFMKLLVVGGGGREHAIIRSLKKNPDVTEIFAAPGNSKAVVQKLLIQQIFGF